MDSVIVVHAKTKQPTATGIDGNLAACGRVPMAGRARKRRLGQALQGWPSFGALGFQRRWVSAFDVQPKVMQIMSAMARLLKIS